jgi:hypothetical protein
MRVPHLNETGRLYGARRDLQVEHGLIGALLVVVGVALFDVFSGSIGVLAREMMRNL